MTILAMLAVTIYFAFSVGVQTWNRQQVETRTVEKLERTLRYLEREFKMCVPFTMSRGGAELSFFLGTETLLFYVTRSGFGSSSRNSELYFSCLSAQEDEGQDELHLSLYKTPVPETGFVEDLFRLAKLSQAQKELFELDSTIQDKSVPLLQGLEGMALAYHQRTFQPWSGIDLSEDNSTLGSGEGQDFAPTWSGEDLPGFIRLELTFEGETYTVRTPLTQDPKHDDES